jgi:excisionase family DNA binding protein
MNAEQKSQPGTGPWGNQIAPVPPAAPGLGIPNAAKADKFAADLPHVVNTIAETAFVLKCSEKSIRRLINRKLLAASRGLRHVRITRQAIMDYLARTSK